VAVERVTINVTDILTPTKAAAYLGVSRMFLWRWVKAGKITPVMLDHAYFHINELNRVRELLRNSKANGVEDKG
jgi:predicted site-specific integrase-resolvase